MKFSVAFVIALAGYAIATPFGEPIDPSFDAPRDVRFLIFTRSNRLVGHPVSMNNLASIDASHYDPNKPTRVVTHGWGGDETTDLVLGATHTLLLHHDFNILVIDWGVGAQTINYAAAVNRVRPTGEFCASYLDFLHQHGRLNYANIKLIGFSLGAHVLGFIGKNVQRGRIPVILGLDPAGPLFNVNNPAGRLDAGDATYVEALHTNGPTLQVVGAGIGAPIGHADFFANGGINQPGCFLPACSHSRSVEFYLEAIGRNGFLANRCANAQQAADQTCTGTPGVWLSAEPSNVAQNLRGIFSFSTRNAAPFALGPVRP